MPCEVCKGKGSIYRPYSRFVQEVIRKTEIINGEELTITEPVTVEMGGMDACPECTRRAEIEYQVMKGNNQMREVS